MKERATFIQDIAEEGKYLFERPSQYDETTVSKKWKDGTAELMTEWLNILATVTPFDHDQIENHFKKFLEEKNCGIGNVLPNFRLLITGTGMGPSMFEIAAFLGKEECISRMKIGLEIISKRVSEA